MFNAVPVAVAIPLQQPLPVAPVRKPADRPVTAPIAIRRQNPCLRTVDSSRTSGSSELLRLTGPGSSGPEVARHAAAEGEGGCVDGEAAGSSSTWIKMTPSGESGSLCKKWWSSESMNVSHEGSSSSSKVRPALVSVSSAPVLAAMLVWRSWSCCGRIYR